MQCDMCGSEGNLVRANVEGTILNVCNGCAKYGNIVRDNNSPKRPFNPNFKKKKSRLVEKEPEIELIEVIVSNYSNKIKNKREELGIKQKDLAIKLAERESIVQKIESGHFEPSLKLAKKLEKYLKIKLIEEIEDKKDKVFIKSANKAMTIGDLIKIKSK